MKVQRPNSANLPATQNTGTVPSKGRLGGNEAGRGDHVQISTFSSALTALQVQSGGHATKVEQLSDVVSSSRYLVDTQVVSARLIQEHMLAA